MQVTLDKVFPLACNADVAWRLLQDIEAVAQCMPGARITERVDHNNYLGTVAVRLGPASLSFKGTITVVSVDADTRSLHLTGKGTDTAGTSGASMDLVATIRADGKQCELAGSSTITMNGKAAAFGGRMMDAVSEQILKQFAANFAQKVQALPAQRDGSAQAPVADTRQAAEPQALNGLALLWAIVADGLRRLFGRKPA